MARGGARNRSGPAPDPSSGRSERRGYKLTALPAEGFDGEAPAWPLPQRQVFVETFVDGQKVREVDEDASQDVAARELELWAWVWSLPQACAWSMTAERWRWHSVAMWVRTAVLCESSEATAADKNSLHRFADQIGLTPAGLRENGWAVAADEVAERRESRPVAVSSGPRPRRLAAAP